MSHLSIFDYNANNIRFETREGQIWVSLTDMGKAANKQVGDYTRLKSSIEYLNALELVMGIPVTETIQGGQPENQGTWAIDEVGIEFASWCSVEFKIWANRQIKTLMTEGKVELVKSKPASHLALAELMLNELKLHEQRLTAIELENLELKKQLQSQDYRVESVEMLADANADELSRFKNGHGFYYSVIGYAAKHEIRDISTPKAAAIGRRATALCKESGISPERVNDTRYGFVNTYPEHILTEVF